MNWLPRDGLIVWKVDILKVGFSCCVESGFCCCCCSVKVMVVVVVVVVEGAIWKLVREIFVGLRVSPENMYLPIYQWQGVGGDCSRRLLGQG